MRVTSNMFPTTLKLQSNDLLQREINVQNQIATGMSIIDPSDDPATFAQVSLLRGQSSQANAYLSATNSLTLQAQSTYAGMTDLQTLLSSVSELMTEANNSSSQTELQIYGQQMQGYAAQLLQIVNQQSNGVYTYGSIGNQPPLISQSTSGNTFAAPAAGDSFTINGKNVTIPTPPPATFADFKSLVEKSVPGVFVTQNGAGDVIMTSTTGPLTVADTTGTYLGTTLNIASNANVVLNNTTNGYTSTVPSSTINTNLTVSLGLTAGSDQSGANNFPGFLTAGQSTTTPGTDLYNLIVNASNDLLNAAGGGADPFAADTTLGGSYNAAVSTMDDAVSNASKYVGRATAQLALLSSNSTDLNNQMLTQKQTMSGLTQLNTANAATDLAQIQTAYQAALQSGAKILNLSLLDYIN